VLGVIFWNYYANTQNINGNTVGSLSDEYYNLFTPADYAFSIWGLIYIGLLAHCIFQIKKVFVDKKEDVFVLQIGPWLIIANICNAIWLDLWLKEMTGTSVFIMFGILISLLLIIIRLKMQLGKLSFPMVAFVGWPISIYSGWITVATIANISAYLVKMEWQVLFEEVTWTVIMIIFATLLNLFMIHFRNMLAFAVVGVWAILAIAFRHWGEIPLLQWTGLSCALLLLLTILTNKFRTNRKNPFKNLET
jgi:hypothetical protein